MQCTVMYVTSLLWTDQCYVVLPILYTGICDIRSMAGINSSMAGTVLGIVMCRMTSVN